MTETLYRYKYQKYQHKLMQIGGACDVIAFYKPRTEPLTSYEHNILINYPLGETFGNFYQEKIEMTHSIGKTYIFNTAEAAFQSFKTFDEDIIESLTIKGGCINGEQAFRIGQKIIPRVGWKEHGINIAAMQRVLSAKWENVEKFKNDLIHSGNTYLLERTDRDAFWGDGSGGIGQNKLGLLLIELREHKTRIPTIHCSVKDAHDTVETKLMPRHTPTSMPRHTPTSMPRHTPTSLPCCQMCKTYQIYSAEYTKCCRECDGTSSGHGRGCKKIRCPSTLCCPTCNIYQKYRGADFCCKTCRDTSGKSHGGGCLKISC